MMKYFSTFDENGNRTATYIEGVHEYIPESAIPHSEDEWKLYCTGEYKRNVTGTPEKIATPDPTTEIPTAEERLTALEEVLLMLL